MIVAADTSPIVLIDDRRGRQAAQSFRLRLIGTIGTLSLACRRGLLSPPAVLYRIRHSGMRFSESLLVDAFGDC